MNWGETFRSSWHAIRSHRLRSALTVLGILIGISAVVLSVGLGLGAQQQVSSIINALGTNLLVVSPGSTTTSGVRAGSGSASTLTAADAESLASKVVAPDIASVAATNSRSESLTVGSTNWTTTVVGTSPDWLSVRNRTVASGRFITTADVTGQTTNVVLAPTTAQELFGAQNPLGQTVNIGAVPFTVIGVLASTGTGASGQSQDDQAIVPISTASNRVFGGATRNSVQTIYVEASSPDTISAAYQEINQLLLVRHGATSAANADFTIASQESLLSSASSVGRILTLLLGGIAALSLLVGGIGVMNIMLVSVTERIREIGLRKALGATPSVIRRQFLVEACMLGLVGGIAGVLLGIVVALILAASIGFGVVVSPLSAAIALATSMIIGIVFGVYPASRAAKLSPIDALRSE